jgi:hypothetical protein
MVEAGSPAAASNVDQDFLGHEPKDPMSPISYATDTRQHFRGHQLAHCDQLPTPQVDFSRPLGLHTISPISL